MKKKRRKNKFFKEPTLKEKIHWRLRKKELTTSDVVMMFALRDGNFQMYYNEHYGDYGYPVQDHVVSAIFRPIISKIPGGWKRALHILSIDHSMYATLDGKSERTYYEWVVKAINCFVHNVDVHFYDKHAPKGWREELDKYRDSIICVNKKWWKLSESLMAETLVTDEAFGIEEGDHFQVIGEEYFNGIHVVKVIGKYELEDAFPAHMLRIYDKDKETSDVTKN